MRSRWGWQSYWHSVKSSVGTLLILAIWIIIFSIIGLDFFCACKFDRHNITPQVKTPNLTHRLCMWGVRGTQ